MPYDQGPQYLSNFVCSVDGPTAVFPVGRSMNPSRGAAWDGGRAGRSSADGNTDSCRSARGLWVTHQALQPERIGDQCTTR